MQQMRRLQHILVYGPAHRGACCHPPGSISGCGVIELQGDLRKLRNDLGSLRSDHERLLIELSCKTKKWSTFCGNAKTCCAGRIGYLQTG